MTIPSPKGTYDILPMDPDPKEQWRNASLWHYVEETIRDQCALYGFGEIRTPVFERLELFQRGVGQETDIVSKEMFVFEDKAGRAMVLRPEGTSAVMRAYIEHKLHLQAAVQKLFYLCPMFRYERPQAGRYRQHTQFGAEVIGNDSPEQDAELIAFLYSLYERLGLKNVTLLLNSVGDSGSRRAYRQALIDYLTPHKQSLSEESQRRFETNPLRILDSKSQADKEILKDAPLLPDFLGADSDQHHRRLCAALDVLRIPYRLEPLLVRGLDYYTNTVFEITSGELGAQNTIGAGGRYDGLLKTLGGPDLPAVGFGAGMERLLLTMLAQGVPLPPARTPEIYLIPLGEQATLTCLALMQTLRAAGVSAQTELSGKKVKEGMRNAVQAGVSYVCVIGDNELQTGTVEIKNMATRQSRTVAMEQLVSTLVQEGKGQPF